MTERCEVTDLEKTGCAHCHPKPKNPTFRAMYAGECPTCKGPIKPGDTIREREDGWYEHGGHR